MTAPWRDRIETLYRLAAERGAIPLGGGFPAPHLFPADALADSSARVLHRLGGEVLQYAWPEGQAELRAWIAERLRARGAQIGADDVLITSGAQQALSVAAAMILSPGDTVSIEPASYPGALEIFEEACATPVVGPARVTYRMPWLANPTGTVLTEGEREALLATGATIIEDEAYAELRFAGPPGRPLLADGRDRVWHIGSFSKTLSPGLRVGWLVPPPHRRHEAAEAKKRQDIQSNGLTQATLWDFLSRDDFEARLETARDYYQGQAGVLAEAIATHLPDWHFAFPAGGFSLWLEAPEAGDPIDFLAAAVDMGVTLDPGRLFEAGHPEGRLTVRVCFSNVTPADLEEGARRLGQAWRTFQ